MSFRTFGTTVVALAVAVSVPMSAAAAAVRPGSAVPAAASANTVSANAQFGRTDAMAPWPAFAVIAMTMALAVWNASHNSDRKSAISRG